MYKECVKGLFMPSGKKTITPASWIVWSNVMPRPTVITWTLPRSGLAWLFYFFQRHQLIKYVDIISNVTRSALYLYLSLIFQEGLILFFVHVATDAPIPLAPL